MLKLFMYGTQLEGIEQLAVECIQSLLPTVKFVDILGMRPTTDSQSFHHQKAYNKPTYFPDKFTNKVTLSGKKYIFWEILGEVS